jgi:linoleoyl-CoA desaturase
MTPVPVEASKQGTTADPNHPLHRLTPAQVEEIGKRFRAIHERVYAELGERDARYIRRLIKFHRGLAAFSRALPRIWLTGRAMDAQRARRNS